METEPRAEFGIRSVVPRGRVVVQVVPSCEMRQFPTLDAALGNVVGRRAGCRRVVLAHCCERERAHSSRMLLGRPVGRNRPREGSDCDL